MMLLPLVTSVAPSPSPPAAAAAAARVGGGGGGVVLGWNNAEGGQLWQRRLPSNA